MSQAADIPQQMPQMHAQVPMPIPQQLVHGTHPQSFIRYEGNGQHLRIPGNSLISVDPQFYPPHYPMMGMEDSQTSMMEWAVPPQMSVPKMDDENPYGPESITVTDPPESFVPHPYYDQDPRSAEMAIQPNGPIPLVKPHVRVPRGRVMQSYPLVDGGEDRGGLNFLDWD
jgi:hypothetical protein